MDLGADRRGVGMGAAALRIAGIKDKLADLGYAVDDLGDVLVPNREDQAVNNVKLKFMPQIAEASRNLAQMFQDSLMQNHLPLCLGGDHSIALGSIAGLAAACRRKGMIPGLIWIDAHPDANTEQTTPTGNIHGMALSASLGLGHPDLVQLFGFGPKIRPENCTVIGVRSIDPLEKENLQQLGVTVFTMTDIDRMGIGAVIELVLNTVCPRSDSLHVSFDLDALDPSFAPGVGTPVPGGLTYREAHLIMEAIAETHMMVSMDVAEVNPVLDIRNQSAEVAAGIVASCLGKRIF
jgi:arginase